MSLADLLFGRPLASSEDHAEKIGVAAGIPIFGLDGLSSAAYGPEAALTLLIPLSAAGIVYILPITFSILVLLTILYFSYRQTIAAYPGGGGSYTVARENIGENAGLLAAAALMIDYVLTVAVGISAGVGALVSALPSLQPHTLALCLSILVIVTLINLRGVREAGVFFMIPTYLFVACLFIMIGIGVVKALAAGGHPTPLETMPPLPAATEAVTFWLLLKVFSSGCAAMTGVEAVSNGVQAFREPTVPNAQKTLTIIIAILMVLLAGVAYLCSAYGIGATNPSRNYESVLSMLLRAIMGKGIFYYVSIGSILLVLSLSANTAFVGFPRLCRIIAVDNYLPHSFASTGRRLVFANGIYVLAALAAGLLTLFGGVTDRLIPLYAVGAFMAFTLSQAGMVRHWTRNKGGWQYIFVNGLGAVATAITTVVVLAAKFAEGAWVTVLLIPFMLIVMVWVRRHYRAVQAEIDSRSPVDFHRLESPIVVTPIGQWNMITQKALRFAYTLSQDVRAVHVSAGNEIEDAFCREWSKFADAPAREAGLKPPELVVIDSPYRMLLTPILKYILQVERDNPGRQVAVLLPEMVERHWFHYFLHNQRAEILKTWLLLKGNQRIVLVSVPWYLDA
ncbi:MAG TPA: APC family permease [Bryobacteraceae bacterium]|nr:APC family permease [Bryobacteraceae bacterium]